MDGIGDLVQPFLKALRRGNWMPCSFCDEGARRITYDFVEWVVLQAERISRPTSSGRSLPKRSLCQIAVAVVVLILTPKRSNTKVCLAFFVLRPNLRTCSFDLMWVCEEDTCRGVIDCLPRRGRTMAMVAIRLQEGELVWVIG